MLQQIANKNIESLSVEHLCSNKLIIDHFSELISELNSNIESHQQVKKFCIVSEEFTEQNNLMTPSLKKKRRNILDKYVTEIETMYI